MVPLKLLIIAVSDFGQRCNFLLVNGRLLRAWFVGNCFRKSIVYILTYRKIHRQASINLDLGEILCLLFWLTTFYVYHTLIYNLQSIRMYESASYIMWIYGECIIIYESASNLHFFLKDWVVNLWILCYIRVIIRQLITFICYYNYFYLFEHS